MESIDALAKAVNEFEGGMVLVSHDMRLISQVAKEIWICDNKTITKHKGDIQTFKMDMRAQMGLHDVQKGQLRGDASVKNDEKKPKKKEVPKKEPLPVITDDEVTTVTATTATTVASDTPPSESPSAAEPTPGKSRYVPPHLRKKMQESS